MIIRPREPGVADESFVFGCWLKSFRASDWSGPFLPELYFDAARKTIERLLARPGVQVLLLDAGPPLDRIGFICHEPSWRRWSKRRERWEQWHVVHYVYVLEQARGKGAARHLLEAAGVRPGPGAAYSFTTRSARGLLGDEAKQLVDAARYESKDTR